MRAALIAALVAFPVFGYAQTPKDIAHQLWPLGAPVPTATAPSQPTAFAGFNHELFRDVWLQRTQVIAPSAVEPGHERSRYVGSFMPSDLARLRDAGGAGAGNPALQDTRVVTLMKRRGS